MNKSSYDSIINDWKLWAEYVDPNGEMTEKEFDEMSDEEKVQLLADCFGGTTLLMNPHTGSVDTEDQWRQDAIDEGW